MGLPMRLTAHGTTLLDNEGRPVVLQGVNMYLEWYKTFYSASLSSGSSAFDVPHLRRSVPAANTVRFVGLLWKDSIMESDGLECYDGDASRGYLSAECVRYIDALITQATDAGLWVIIAARAKYAAGWGLGQPDVWGDPTLRAQMVAMWRWIAHRYKNVDRIAGYEIMSEPRNKGVSQSAVTQFMREGCEAVHSADPRSLCVVGPRPYYKLWELSDEVLQPRGSNTLYTFDFFVPRHFVMSDSSRGGGRYPGTYSCKDVYDGWWGGKPGCHSSGAQISVDDSWLQNALQTYAVGFAERNQVPVHCNQWGVKDEVLDSFGRQAYAQAMLRIFAQHKMSSTYWIWRSYRKDGRDVDEPVWGFELAHNDGPHESLDSTMLATLQQGFALAARQNAGNAYPCAIDGVARFGVAPSDSSVSAKALTLAQPSPVRKTSHPRISSLL